MTYALARSPNRIATPTTFSASDSFPTTGTLTGKTLSGGGGQWTLVSGSDADPFNVIAGGIVERTSTSDAPSGNLYNSSEGQIGHAEYASGPSLSTLFAQADFSFSSQPSASGVRSGHFLRFADDQNFVFVGIQPEAQLSFQWASGGGLGGAGAVDLGSLTVNSEYTLSVLLQAAGGFTFWVNAAGAALGTPIWDGTQTGLSASGKCGIFDSNFTAEPCSRRIKNYRLWVPSTNAALYANRSARFLHDTAVRESSNGSQEGRVPVFEGKHLTTIPATRAGRTTRLVVKTRRGDSDSGQADAGLTDNLLAELTVTPRVVLLPIGGIAGFPVYTLSNISTDHGFNANVTTLNELANNLGTVINELPLPIGTWSNTNVVTSRTLNANSITINKLADILATLIADLALPGPHPPYTVTNVSQRRIMNATTITINDFTNVLGTLINDLNASGDL